MGVIEKLEQFIRKVYHRNKIPPRVKAKAVLLYHWGVALRKVERFIKALGLRGSREAIRQWYHRLSRLVEYVLRRVVRQLDEPPVDSYKRYIQTQIVELS